jgi:cytosine/uracil/thiamine/allantoin permease
MDIIPNRRFDHRNNRHPNDAVEAARRSKRLHLLVAACYSGGLGSIAGVLIADYWIVRNKNLNLGDLYRTKGEYRGWNWRAVVATLLGCFFAWIGLIIPTLGPLYDYAWFVGFGVAFSVHWGLMKIAPQAPSPQD